MRHIIGLLFLLIATILFLSSVYDYWNLSSGLSYPLIPNLIVLSVALGCLLAFRRLTSARRLFIRQWVLQSLLFVIGFIMTISVMATVYTDYQLRAQIYPDVYDNCYKVWAARGLNPGNKNITHTGTQNSIESIQLAFDSGAHGTEVDIYFDTQRGEFIVSHDIPYNLKNGEILTLESLFDATSEAEYFWLDFKKMRHLDFKQLDQSVAELERLAARKDLKRRIYVEGEAPFSLAAYRDAGFKTIFDTHPLVDSHPLTPAIINLYKTVFYFGGYSVMGLNYGGIDAPIYGKVTQASLAGIPVFVYHVDDDAETLKLLSMMKAVRVILVENHSLNRYSVNACPDNG